MTDNDLTTQLLKATNAKEIEAVVVALVPPAHSSVCDLLESLVFENKEAEARAINEGGVPAQLAYLADDRENARSLVDYLIEAEALED